MKPTLFRHLVTAALCFGLAVQAVGLRAQTPTLPPAGPGSVMDAQAPPGSPLNLSPSGGPQPAGREVLERALGEGGNVPARPAGVPANTPDTYDFFDAPLIQVFRILATAAGSNFIAPAIPPGERITVHLEKVTPMQAFRDIARLRGFEVVDEGGLLTLRRPDLTNPTYTVLRTYKVSHVAVDLIFQQVANALGIVIASPGEQSPAFPKAREAAVSGTGLDAQARPRFVSGLPMDERMYVSETNKGTSIGMDRRQNAIVLRGTADEHDAARRILSGLDIRMPQIQVTIHVVEVDMQNNDVLGVDWSNTLGNDGWKLGLRNFSGDNEGLMRFAKGLFYQGAILTTSEVNVVIRALRGNSKTVNLSSPHVITQAGIPVNISAFERETVAIVQNTTTGNQTTPTTTLQPFTTGLTLSVTPRLLGNGRIALNLNPQLSSKIGSTTSVVGSIPITSERGAVTEVTVNNGDAVVLGGIVNANSVVTDNKVPFLGNIPIVGMLFRSKGKTARRTNLIFIVQTKLMPDSASPRTGWGSDEETVFNQVADLPGVSPLINSGVPRGAAGGESKAVVPQQRQRRVTGRPAPGS